MTKRLQSVDLELYGVQHTFYFDEPVAVPGDDDEVSVGNDILRDVTSLEVVLVEGGIASGSVEVSYTIRGTVTVELESPYEPWEDASELQDYARESDETFEAISQDVAYGNADIEVDDISVESAYDEDGNEVDF